MIRIICRFRKNIIGLKKPKPPQQPPSSDKDKEDYKEEFEPNPDFGKDF